MFKRKGLKNKFFFSDGKRRASYYWCFFIDLTVFFLLLNFSLVLMFYAYYNAFEGFFYFIFHYIEMIIKYSITELTFRTDFVYKNTRMILKFLIFFFFYLWLEDYRVRRSIMRLDIDNVFLSVLPEYQQL